MNERDTRWNWDGPITRLHPFAWDVQRWWHDISDISPWIHSISADRKSMCIQSPPHRGSDSYIGLPRVFSDIFAVYFTFHGKLTRTKGGGFVHVTSKELWRIIGNEEWGSNPSSYLWNRLELAWFNFAFELRDLFVPFKTLGSDTSPSTGRKETK